MMERAKPQLLLKHEKINARVRDGRSERTGYRAFTDDASAPEGDMSWEISHLPPLTRPEAQALVDMMSAWYANRAWQPAPEDNVPLIWEYAERHGFSGALGALALEGKFHRDKLDEVCRRRYFSNMLHHEKCLAACRRLQRHAILLDLPMAVMKGPALIAEGYADAGVRSYSDIDIIVGSRNHAWQLMHSLGAETIEDARESGVGRRGEHPGRLHADLDGWELEFCYPVKWRCDPLFDLFSRHGNRILRVPVSETVLQVPDPDVHLVILFQHMIRHLCNRFIWFLDIAVFVRYQRERLDWKWVAMELDRLQLRNSASLVSRFCNRFIDPEFPILAFGLAGWNSDFQEAMISLDQVQGGISLFHRKGWRRGFRFLLSPARVFLITDPKNHNPGAPCTAAAWTAARLMHALDINHDGLYQIFKFGSSTVFLPFVRMFSKLAARQRSYAQNRV